MKITSPIEGHNDTTSVGPHTLQFRDGVAEVEHLTDGAKAWLKARGYGIGSAKPRTPERDATEPADPREVSTERVGTRIRDGAVDPREGDFLAPTNAGQANPHGPDVVNPSIHAEQGSRPVKGGDVHVGDPEAQDAAETAHAEQAASGQPAEGFDPGKHTVEQVHAYLGVDEDHDPVTEVEFDRVIDAERQGKARKGILELADGPAE